MDTLLGCESTSEDITVEKLESPVALFEVSPQEINENEDVEITMADMSVDAVEWFWELSNGNRSSLQNPVFPVNSFTPITVTLTITAANGCQDTSSVIIDIITSLEDSGPQNEWRIYPNPASSSFLFDLANEKYGPYEVFIYSQSGKIIRKIEFYKSTGFVTEQIDLTGLPRGIYLVRLQQLAGGSLTKRIIIR
jgi:PKD repeat protein